MESKRHVRKQEVQDEEDIEKKQESSGDQKNGWQLQRKQALYDRASTSSRVWSRTHGDAYNMPMHFAPMVCQAICWWSIDPGSPYCHIAAKRRPYSRIGNGSST